ncbi:MAG: MucB/RseB C-terminal domain-containing protein [Gammaproteobacteria bacterium]|nr:MucB/RseB C-terminal domain-containing protein [Gammaproteobacteria bacterium]MDH5239461.1 MucB/RseB C-terminal domain-containing protein [Gammaproteobacteria bacterium]MDH5260402.1 MucB/RseB C-terminal domain-containing protein [Gammaproteobacteria bacterium]MDH5583152.1 MucB/RseB C-terminal domain-containing protein [Gammaproteobacteria bacterium]
MSVSPSGVAIRLLAVLCLFAGANPALAEVQPQHWLDRMAVAVQSTSYEGTVIRIKDGSAEALKIVHTVKDGVIREKVVAQEGDGLEIIRIGNEVHCILPDRKSVLVEEWNNQSSLFSTLPNSDIRFGNEYDLVFMGAERVAGREAIRIAIRPHDAFRYAHQIWLDTETGFPLQTQLISEGIAIEQVKFAEIALNHEIHASALEPSYSTKDFTWLQQTSGHAGTNIETTWVSDELPAGFKAVSTHEEIMSGTDEVVTHILFSDGLANVSVFIAANSGELASGPARVGGSNSFSVERGEFEITAIGEVPAITVKQIATTMRPL